MFSSCFQPCWSPIDRHRLVSDVIHASCTSVAPVCTKSCGDGHGNSFGIVHGRSCIWVHANSSGTNACGNSRMERGHDDRGGTELPSSSALSMVRRPAVGELACFFTAGARQCA